MRAGILSRPYVYIPVSAGLLLLVVVQIPLADLDRVLATTRADLLLLAVGLNLAVLALWALRSWLLLAQLGHRLTLADTALLALFANTVNNVTPASTGEIARAVLLERRHGVPIASGTAVILIERVAGLYLMLVTVSGAWIAVLGDDARIGAVAVIAMIALVVAPTASYRLGLRPIAGAGRLLGGASAGRIRAGVGRTLVEVDQRVAQILIAPRPMASYTVTTLAIFAVYAVQFALVAAAFGAPIAILAAWAIQGAALITGVLSAIPFGLGPAEGAITILLPVVNVSLATAGLIAIGFRLISSVPITVLGAAAYVLIARGGSEQGTSGGQATR